MQAVPASASGTVQLGDLTVNRMGYGAMRITGKGIWGPPADRDAALATLRRAVELGVNLIDTADSYGPDVSEELIAEALTPYPSDLVIATKGGWERVGPGQWTHNASPKHLEAAVHGSLKRLRLDRIDVYQLHVPDPAVSFDASMDTLARLQDQGKIRHVGLSNVTLEHLERARRMVPIVSVQNRYSFADREWDYLLNRCDELGIAFMPWAPLKRCREFSSALESASGSSEHAHRQIAPGVAAATLSIAMLPIPGTSSVAPIRRRNVAAAGLEDYRKRSLRVCPRSFRRRQLFEASPRESPLRISPGAIRRLL